MRAVTITLALGVLAACSPPIPDSGAPYDPAAKQAREQALTQGGMQIDPLAISDEDTGGTDYALIYPATAAAEQPQPQAEAPVQVQAPTQENADLAAETAAALAAANANSGVPPIEASPSNPTPVVSNNPGISDENDFDAVSGRQTIESDAERLARNREQFTVIEPGTVPTRPGDADPNIVSYALSSSNPVGVRVYSRVGINMAKRAERNCAGFPSPDQAQIAFLAKGGPEKDRLGLDPDGDGYACAWDPTPFRLAVQN